MAAMRRVGRLIAALVVVWTALCPAAAATPSQADPPYSTALVWSSCVGVVADVSQLPTAQCGTVAVPVDYAKPQGAQAQLAIIKVPATGPRIGVLIVNPGGPGASAVDTVAGMGAALADTEILQRFDLVGIDPRGVGHSTPQLRCRTDAEFDAYRAEPMADYSPAGVAHIEELHQKFAAQCLDRMGADFLANIGTAAAARDMDVVRAALGEDRINYLGFSYGTNSVPPTPTATPTGCEPWSSTARWTPASTRSPRASTRSRDSSGLSTGTPPIARSRPDAPWAPTRHSSSVATNSSSIHWSPAPPPPPTRVAWAIRMRSPEPSTRSTRRATGRT